jgi:hypothetical protein
LTKSPMYLTTLLGTTFLEISTAWYAH